MSEDNRSGIQKLLNKTRWEPFSYITDGNVILRRPGSLYQDVAMMTTAIISHMMYTVKREDDKTKNQVKKDDSNEQ